MDHMQEHLDLDGCYMARQSFHHLAQSVAHWRSLVTLNLAFPDTLDTGMSVQSLSKSLRGCPCGSTGGLHRLALGGVFSGPVATELLPTLATYHQNLLHLDLGVHVDATADGIHSDAGSADCLASLTKLTFLRLPKTTEAISTFWEREIVSGFPVLGSLKVLDLSHSQLGLSLIHISEPTRPY